MKKLKLENFELSQAHLFFWDKLNKSNYYLETIIENAELPVDDRLINHLSGDLISDGYVNPCQFEFIFILISNIVFIVVNGTWS